MLNEQMQKMPRLKENVLLQDVQTPQSENRETVIVLPNKNQIKVVNEVGSFVLHLIDGKRTVASIVQEVHRQYAAPLEQIEQDVVKYLEQLAEKEIITLETVNET
jgi:coenzyme PQQ biosynthesis protein PqqD